MRAAPTSCTSARTTCPSPSPGSCIGPEPIIGLSSHASVETAAAAAEPLADYFCTGPVWPTPTKPGRPAPGLDLVRYAAGLGTARPWFAIGGIDESNLDEVLVAGATRIVVVRVLTDAEQPGAARSPASRAAGLVLAVGGSHGERANAALASAVMGAPSSAATPP